MNNYSRHSLNQALSNQLRRLGAKIDVLNKLTNKLSLARLGCFVGGLVLIYLAGQFGPEWLFWISILAFLGGFWKLARYHKKIEETTEHFKVWKSIRSAHQARMQLKWPDIPKKNPTQKYDKHPFGSDLDIIGQHSLLQLIDTANYQGGTDKLAEYLLQPKPELEKIKKRQQIVRELTGMPQFRDRLHLRAQANKKEELEGDWDLETLLDYLKNSEEANYQKVLAILGTLSVLNIVLGILYFAGFLPPYVFFSFVLYLVIYNFNSEKVSGLYDEAKEIKKLLTQFNGVLTFLEHHNYDDTPQLKNHCKPFWNSAFSPSKYINQIIRIASAASSQQSEVIWALLNFLMPWDVYFAQKLSSYKQQLAPRLEKWIRHFYELEAFSSMANFAWINPQYTFSCPQPQNKTQTPFKASDLGHPLIPEKQKVTNDININNNGEILLITGSNMAGKSTFLRTTGINLALCFAGAPVNASSFSTIPFQLFSSINITDSLDSGLSHFYAEVKRLRALMELLDSKTEMPLFFMIDEIYRGTNNRERLQGSEAFLKQVAGRNGIGLVSTHDLELAQLQETIPQLSNWHFAETLEDGKMSFEYKLRSGPCPTTNALKIMEMEGLPT